MKGISRQAIILLKQIGILAHNIFVSFGPYICRKCHEFDLADANIKDFVSEGIPRKNIQAENRCTFEDKKYFSWRKEGKESGRMMSVIYKESS